jgi:hypothetical protein
MELHTFPTDEYVKSSSGILKAAFPTRFSQTYKTRPDQTRRGINELISES